MNWWNRKPREVQSPVEDDIEQARRLRQAAEEEYAELRAQAPAVRKMTQRIINRGIANHFGDSIQITYVRNNHR